MQGAAALNPTTVTSFTTAAEFHVAKDNAIVGTLVTNTRRKICRTCCQQDAEHEAEHEALIRYHKCSAEGCAYRMKSEECEHALTYRHIAR